MPHPPCAAVLATGGSCGAKPSHSIHVLALGLPGAHAYLDGSKAGLSPIGKARERFNASDAGKQYNAVTAALKAGEVACQIQSPVCTGMAEHQHESLSRGRAGGLKAAIASGFPVFECCDRCNEWCSGEGNVWARERGFLFSMKDVPHAAS